MFLDYARPAQRPSEAVDLSALAADSASRLGSEDGVQITLALAERAIIAGDQTDIRRLLGNLIENARKYGRSAEDGIAHVTIRTSVSFQRVELSVLDEGTGVPEDQLELLTRPFYRVETARTQADGTGLGMAIVLRLVNRHRGILRIANRDPGTGLEVTVTFPARIGI